MVGGGEVLYAGAVAPLVASEEGVFEVRGKGDPKGLKKALELAGCVVRRETAQGSTLEVRVPKGEDGKPRGANFVLETAIAAGEQVRHVAPLVQTLERAFFKTLADAGQIAPEGAGGEPKKKKKKKAAAEDAEPS